MRLPSVKTIETRLWDAMRYDYVDPHRAAIRIRRAMEQATGHDSIDRALEAINGILSGYGIEAIEGRGYSSYYGHIGLLYVNMGDTYTTTVVYDTRKQQWIVASWGDLVERDEKRFLDR